MKKLFSILYLLSISCVSFCQDFVGQSKVQINREVEEITKKSDNLHYQTAGLGQIIVEIYDPKENESRNPSVKKEIIPADKLSFTFGENSAINIECHFLSEKSTCDSVVIHCYDSHEGQRLIEHLKKDSFRKWKSMGNNEYLSLQSLGVGSNGRFDYVTTAKMLIEYPEEERLYAKATIVKTQIAKKDWNKLKKQKK